MIYWPAHQEDMYSLIYLIHLLLALRVVKVVSQSYKADGPIVCSNNNRCPEAWPCCSPYGECGVGPMCIIGCNPKSSFDHNSCIPLPILISPLQVTFHSRPVGLNGNPDEPDDWEEEEDDDDDNYDEERGSRDDIYNRCYDDDNDNDGDDDDDNHNGDDDDDNNSDGDGNDDIDDEYNDDGEDDELLENDRIFEDVTSFLPGQASSPALLEQALNRVSFIHNTKFLITPSDSEAIKMLGTYNFIYSGYANVHHGTGDILLAMPKRTTGSLIGSGSQMLYGRVSVVMRTARSPGVVTAIVLISQVGDEVDFEFIGSELLIAQTNHYYMGELIHTNMQKQPISSDSWRDYHKYEIDWNEERIEWIIDGRVVRTLFKRETWDPVTGVFKYPQTPARLDIAVWPGGNENNNPGTIQWAGGLIDWENSPDIIQDGQFSAYVREIVMIPKVNSYDAEVGECLREEYGNIVGNLQRVTSRYNPGADPSFGEDSIELMCHYIPRLSTLMASGNTENRLGAAQLFLEKRSYKEDGLASPTVEVSSSASLKSKNPFQTLVRVITKILSYFFF